MLKVKDIDVFIGHKKIIKDVSFQVPAGAIVGLVGPNGAGKTTIMKTILGLTKFKGNILVANQTVTENNHLALANVGALIEHPAIYPFLTGLQNLELYARDKGDMVQLTSTLEMDSYINTKAKGYSLGMKQKLGIAIALLNQPQLVILDEPMNGLDIEATISVRKLIKHYAEQGTAFLISSHVLSELQKVMNQVVLINAGKIIINQSTAEFNRVSRQNYKVITEDNPCAMQILQKQKISFTPKDDYLVVRQKDIFTIQDELFKNRLHLQEMLPLEANFENIIVNILDRERGKNDAH
ncbi:ABC transporter ATP-binding protein [Bombilactobacillus bombi]|uniref:ABC transporter ATP-binding protein n=1 Tax=Bombilactobacillus bombi TaxID=1303590 RepID=UPI0015E5EAC7|nr:ATP-binding cassette domain-containing protein [Bombilactobacillus bombi]MBA1434844.1 ATP-binding cassette domain-containing protein [Bombilactobacillus bombi]